LPNEVVEIDSAYFRSDFMEVIPEETLVIEVAEVEPVAVEVTEDEAPKEEGEPTSESKPASRKRRS